MANCYKSLTFYELSILVAISQERFVKLLRLGEDRAKDGAIYYILTIYFCTFYKAQVINSNKC